ncbi:MAG: hypothetical protein VB142_00055 [Burkholderia sp.]
MADLALSVRAAAELIRYDSPDQIAFRIASGKVAAWLNGSGNRYEMIHERANHQLDFDRPKRRPLSFGSAEPHAGVGVVLARIQFIGFLDGMRPWLARAGYRRVDGSSQPARSSEATRRARRILLIRFSLKARPTLLDSGE